MNDDLEALLDMPGALLLTVLDQTHDCIMVLSIDGKIQFVNRQGALAMDLAAPSEIIGESYLTRWPAENTLDVAGALSEARDGRLGRFTAPKSGSGGSLTWWDVRLSPVCDRTGSITHLVSIARDLTSEIMERKRAEAISLEMRHRLKNAMTVAGGIVMLSARGSPEAKAFATEVVSRLSQLGSVQASLMDPAADKSLPQVVRLLAVAYGSGANLAFGNLPDVQLSDTSMQALSLCYGELATNSLKYGALKNGGQIYVDGAALAGFVQLSWSEDTDLGDGRAGGQGLVLIDRLITTAGGSFQRAVSTGKLIVTVKLPIM